LNRITGAFSNSKILEQKIEVIGNYSMVAIKNDEENYCGKFGFFLSTRVF
jgi:hypothetical protein